MKQSPLILLAASFLLASGMLGTMASADLDYYGIETVLERNLVAHTTTTLIFDKPINHLDYNLDFNINNMSVRTSDGTSRCGYQNLDQGSVISCDFYGMTGVENKIIMSFSTRNAIKRVGDDYEFRTSYPIATPTDRMFSMIKLPANSMLAEDIVNQSYFPPDGQILTDGKRILITWDKHNLTVEDSLDFSVLFELAGTAGYMWGLLIISLTGIVVMAMIVVAVFMRRGSAPTIQKEVKVLPLLNKDEKRMVDIIAREGGEARQRLLVKESDFSKAKVSRLVKNLRERGVVDTEPISGRENKVILKIKGVGE